MYEAYPTQKGEKVDWKIPSKRLYDALGYDGVMDLMYRFYDEIYDSAIATFFPQDEEEFDEIKHKNALFFVQLLGGEKVHDVKGDMNEHILRIHDEFSIYDKTRFEWLGCMDTVLRQTPIEQDIKDEFWDYLEKFSRLTVNTFSDGSNYYATTSVQ